ncbi:hypothetical protein F0562_007401 [Nyssa sinensis]|uniref:Serine-threonine/tyrosine-protein kinase catalytic domain-containing protein n=1 Tax=Nyssa sinensis TaxID=561372 RepID=A0A5J5A6I5_9ASTE|nr:hypothetical protein F0562_007401 [Nyssa sinensis]
MGHASAHRQIKASQHCGPCYQKYNGFKAPIPSLLLPVAVLCVQPEPSYRPLITDVLHSLVPLVPVELGGTLRVAQPVAPPGAVVPSGC